MTGPVDRRHRVRNSVLGAVIVHGRLAFRKAVVVDDDVATGRELRVEGNEDVHRGFVEVAVQSHEGKLIDGRRGEGVAEPTHEEPYLVVEQAVSGKLALTCSTPTASWSYLWYRAPASARYCLASGLGRPLEGICPQIVLD